MKLILISDPLLNDYGSTRPVVLLGRAFSRKYEVSVVSVKISEPMRERLESYGIRPIDLGVKLLFREPSVMWFEACLRELLFTSNLRRLRRHKPAFNEYKLLSFTCIVSVPADIAYGLGVVSLPLKAAVSELPLLYRLAGNTLRPLASYIDKKLIIDVTNSARIVIASSRYCASLYGRLKIKVHDVIYPPMDCDFYKPATSRPSADYVLSYLGKETSFSVVKKVADEGIRIKAFGAKLSQVPKYLRHHSNVELLGHVSSEELVALYSNAHYVLYPFTDEVFGYIPVESMACGTPVLTYARQGPGETVIDGMTGWLAYNDDDMIKLAMKLESNGYSDAIRDNCRKRSLYFDIKEITKEWSRYL